MRNIARLGRRELIAHRTFDVGMTASVPAYKEVDGDGHKEWVVDVYFAPSAGANESVLKDIVVVPAARDLVGDIGQPVRLERSKQGKYTVVGRSKFIPSGAQSSTGTILEPTFHETKVNLADLGLLFIPDLDFEVGAWKSGPYKEGDYRPVRATDAFGHQVMGPEVPAELVPASLGLEPRRTVTTRHVQFGIRPWKEGSYKSGDYKGSFQRTVTLVE